MEYAENGELLDHIKKVRPLHSNTGQARPFGGARRIQAEGEKVVGDRRGWPGAARAIVRLDGWTGVEPTLAALATDPRLFNLATVPFPRIPAIDPGGV